MLCECLLYLCVCVCVHACVRVCVCKHASMCWCVYMCMCLKVCKCLLVCACMHVHACIVCVSESYLKRSVHTLAHHFHIEEQEHIHKHYPWNDRTEEEPEPGERREGKTP